MRGPRFAVPLDTGRAGLGRPLSGNAANMQFNLIAANSQFLDRRNELDLRFGKVLKMNRAKAMRRRRS
jgi:hypothetical protein